MAEIKVEPKRRAPIWPWIIGIIILLGLIWLLVEAFERGEPEERLEDTMEDTEDAVEDNTGEVGSLYPENQQSIVLTIYASNDSQKITA